MSGKDNISSALYDDTEVSLSSSLSISATPISASEEYLRERHPIFGSRIAVEMKKMHENAIPIKPGTEDSAAFDFYAYEEFRVKAYSKLMFPAGWAFAIPSGVAGWITPRSGMSHKLTLSVNNSPGLIDADYRGEVFITFRNYGENDIVFEKDSKVAQFTFIPVFSSKYVNLVEVAELYDTARGEGGFGHTDAK